MSRPQIQRRDSEIEGTLKKLGRRLMGNGPGYDDDDTRNSSEGSYYALENEYIKLSRKYDKKAEELTTLQALFNSKHEENTQIKKGADKMLLNMEKKELFLGPQMEDEAVRSTLFTILGQIATWSRPFASRAATDIPSFSDIEPSFAVEMRQLVPGNADIEEFLPNTKSRREFARGWVGFCIARYLFQAPYQWLDTDTANSVGFLEGKLTHAGRIHLTALQGCAETNRV